ncbi:MAG: VOC family protein [Anaerolineae bacterium]|nr:VOC family protein [Anaerolineae bacterium]
MQKIVPYLWFDKEAKEAAALYTATFPDSRIESVSTLHDTPSGDVDMVTVRLCGQRLDFMSAGPLFKFTPAISFVVECPTAAEVDAFWAALSPGGSELMPLGEYPFSPRFAWVQDRYGVSWQFLCSGVASPRITPMLMFVGANCGKAEAAMQLYTSLFQDSRIDALMRYGADEAPDREGTVNHAGFTLAGQSFAALDSAHAHQFNFTEAISLMVYCADQAEIDHFWDALSAVPEAEQCGWLKDRYGVSWQIVPTALDAMMSDPDPHKAARVTEAFLKMKKFDLAALERAYAG